MLRRLLRVLCRLLLERFPKAWRLKKVSITDSQVRMDLAHQTG